jgi:hypothetical protein
MIGPKSPLYVNMFSIFYEIGRNLLKIMVEQTASLFQRINYYFALIQYIPSYWNEVLII